jgi:predicted deacylase
LTARDNGTITLARAADDDGDSESASEADQVAATSRPESEEPKEKRGGSVMTAFSKAGEGGIDLHLDISIPMAEMAKWSPDRITRFMAGLAAVLAAKGEIERAESQQQ